MKRVVLVVLFLLLAAACRQAPPVGPDTTPPKLVSSSPSAGTVLVEPDEPLELTFSRAIAPDSLVVAIDPEVALAAANWSTARIVTLVPQPGWVPGTEHIVTIDASDLAGIAMVSTTVTFSVRSDIEPPAAPAGLSASVVDNGGGFTLTWEENTEADLETYIAYWGPDPLAPNATQPVPAPASQLQVTGLVNGLTYHYFMVAVDSAGNVSEPSAQGHVVVDDFTPPMLLETSPADGDLEVDAVPLLRFVFSEPTEPTSFQVGICTEPPGSTLKCALSLTTNLGMVIVSEGGTVFNVDASSEFPYTEDLYRVGVLAEDLAGNPLENDVSILFGYAPVPDETPPTVMQHGFTYDFYGHTGHLEMVFSEPMDRASVEAAFLSAPTLTCTFIWLADDFLRCNAPVQQFTNYGVTLATSATDLAGNPLAEAWSMEMPVGNLAPRLVSTSPANGAILVNVNTSLVFRFSEPLASASIVLNVTAGGSVVPGNITWNPTATEFTLQPFAPLPVAAFVEWHVAGAKGVDGNDIRPGGFSGSFSTAPVVGGAANTGGGAR